MRTFKRTLLALLLVLSSVSAQDTDQKQGSSSKGIMVKLSDLDDVSLKTDEMTFNNLCVRESEPVVGVDDQIMLGTIQVRGCYRNRGTKLVAYSVVIVGLDRDGEPLWACTLSGNARPDELGKLKDGSISVPFSGLQQTTTVRLRAQAVPIPSKSRGS